MERIHKIYANTQEIENFEGHLPFFIYIFFKCSGIEFRQFTHIQPVWDIGTTVQYIYVCTNSTLFPISNHPVLFNYLKELRGEGLKKNVCLRDKLCVWVNESVCVSVCVHIHTVYKHVLPSGLTGTCLSITAPPPPPHTPLGRAYNHLLLLADDDTQTGFWVRLKE